VRHWANVQQRSDAPFALKQQGSMTMNTATVAQMRELTGKELDLVSGGKVYSSSIGGLTFSYDDKTNETTVGAGGNWVTTNPGSNPNNGKCAFINWTSPA
jgi:hypothetical protein